MRASLAAVVWAVMMGTVVGCLGAVELTVLSPAQEAAPGAFVTHVFAALNIGETSQTYNLSFAAPSGWDVVGAPDTISLQPGEEETLFVTLTIPPDAQLGEHTLVLNAVSTEDPTDHSSSAAQTIVSPINEIEIQPPAEMRVSPGDVADYTFTLINRGTAQDSLDIAVVSSRGFPVDLSDRSVHLAPQERFDLSVRLTIPAAAEPGRDVLTVVATSSLYAAVEATGVVFTTILPPAPEAVGGTLMEQLPGRFRLSIDKNVFTGAFDSRLSFSVSGRVLDGYFSSYVNVSNPLGSDPVEVGSYSILYRRLPTTYAIGNVSSRPTDLISLSCEGASIGVDDEFHDIVLIGGGTDADTRFAGYVALGPERANVGAGYFDIRTELTRRALWSVTAASEPLEDWTMRAEGALGIDEALTSRAFFFNTTINTDGYFFSGDAFSVGTYFPGSKRDSAGISLSHRLRISKLSLSISLSHTWNNVVADPLATTRIRDRLGFNLVTTPVEDGPRVTSTAEFEWERAPDPTQKSEIDLLLSCGFTETNGVFPYSFSGKTADQIDHVLGTHYRTLTFSEGAGLSIDSFYLYLRLTQEKRLDLLADVVLSDAANVSLLFRPEGSLHEASITLRNTEDSFNLAAAMYIRFTDDLDLVFDGAIGWDRGDAEAVTFGWGIGLNADIEIPIPFLRTKGRIEGRVFIDVNGSGTFDGDDLPVGGAVVTTGQSEVSTNDQGVFRFFPFYPGTYALSLSQLPIGAASAAPIEVALQAGETVCISLPLAPASGIHGVVFEDLDRDAQQEEGETGFAQVRVLLIDDGGNITETSTDHDGVFTFLELRAGRYVASIDPGTLPERFVFTTSGEIVGQVAGGAATTITFGGYIRPLDVIVTFQPPTADFIVQPDPVIAGQPTILDGTFSFDFDGEIVAYAWDLDADGETDSTEAIVEYVFPARGAYDISLTVTDGSGNRDTITITISVSAESVSEAAVPGDGEPAAEPSSVPTTSFQPPVADFQYAPAHPRVGQPVFFDGTLSFDFDGQLAGFSWDFDGDSVADVEGANVARTFATTGTYVVRLTVTDSDGNSDTVAYSIEVAAAEATIDASTSTSPFQLPIADFVYAPSQPTIGEPVTFDGSPSVDLDGQIASYVWDFDGDGEPDSSDAFATFSFQDAGDHVVRLTVTDNDGNTDTVGYTIAVQGGAPSPDGGTSTIQPPIADFQYTPAQPTLGEPVTFDGTLSFDMDGDIASYAWDFGADGTVDAIASVVDHVFPVAGAVTVRLTVTDDDGNSDSVEYTVAVQAAPESPEAPPDEPAILQPPIADFDFMPESPLAGELVMFNASSSVDPDGAIVAYAWDLNGDGTTDATEVISVFIFPSPGTYNASLTVTDDDGNTDTLTDTIEVQ